MDERLTKNEKKALRQEKWQEEIRKQETKNKIQTIGYWALGALLVGLGLWALIAFSSGTTTNTAALKQPPITSSDFQINPSGKVTLVEYADFQCPACKAYYPVVKQLQKDYGDKLRFVYRMFPLKTVHQNAMNSAKAAYASSKQGKFWEMHDKLFETQTSWATIPDPQATFIGYAKDLGLDTAQFSKDYNSSETIDFVNKSYDTAITIGLSSTPTFFVNGKQIDNPNGYSEFKKLIDAALK